jgi:DNA ligase D-like protein (predicted 3'-phosphoesterase)
MIEHPDRHAVLLAPLGMTEECGDRGVHGEPDIALARQRAKLLGVAPVHPEAALEIDLARGVSALAQELYGRARALAGRDAGWTASDRTHPRQSGSATGLGSSVGARASSDSLAGDAALGDYRARRDFRLSPEPAGDSRLLGGDGEPIFVVHKHRARSEHYDFRLEVDGVLKSWAVPKGPSTDPREKRLAMRVEDHPIEYADFEGVIPEGQYGAGAVIVWDAGTYCNRTKRGGAEVPIGRALEEGHVVVELHGHKLRGGYALTRTGTDQRGRERWLLVKKRDAAADADQDILSTRPESVQSGRTVEQLAAEEG